MSNEIESYDESIRRKKFSEKGIDVQVMCLADELSRTQKAVEALTMLVRQLGKHSHQSGEIVFPLNKAEYNRYFFPESFD